MRNNYEASSQRIAAIASRYGTAGGKGVWALVDQGIVSLGTFFVGVLLARNLAPEEYGVFALILGSLFFLNAIHTAMISYPLTIKGATASAEYLGELTGASMKWTLVVSIPLAIAMGTVVAIISEWNTVPWAILAVLGWQMHETARRGLMTHLRHRDLLPGDFVKFGGWALVTLLLIQTDRASLGSVIASLAVLSCIACVIQSRQVGLRFSRLKSVKSTATDAWRLGKLVLLAGILAFFVFQFPPWLLAAVHGLEFAARLQALILIVGLMHPILFSIPNVLLPAVSRASAEGGFVDARRVGLFYGGLGGVAILPFIFIVVAFPGTILTIFFGSSSPYLDLQQELRILGCAYIFIYSSQVITGLLNGVRRVPAGFLAQVAGTVTAILIGVPLIVQWGVLGACIAACTTHIVQVSVGLAYLHPSDRLPWSHTVSIEPEQEASPYARVV